MCYQAVLMRGEEEKEEYGRFGAADLYMYGMSEFILHICRCFAA